MIDPERPKMFDKSRPFFGASEGASRTTEVCKNGFMVGFEVSNVAASPAATSSRKPIKVTSFFLLYPLFNSLKYPDC